MISKQTQRKLNQLVIDRTPFEDITMEPRNIDEEDFKELSIWQVKELVQTAYLIGKGEA